MTLAHTESVEFAGESDARKVAPKNIGRVYKYYDLIMAAYVCILLCANLIGPAKVATVQVPVFGKVTFVAGVLFFPLSYIFGDILTEVYGYARARRVIWAGFGALLCVMVLLMRHGSQYLALRALTA